MTPENPSEISRMRISDADRDKVASVLGNALAEGRLTAEEHADRLDAVYAAKVHADIAPIVSDLPGATTALATTGSALTYRGDLGKRARMVAFFSGVRKRGAWHVPPDTRAVTIFGGIDLDLRQAALPQGEIRIRAVCLLGGIDIIVPPEMLVIDDGWAVMGGIEVPPGTPESNAAGAPVLRFTGVTILGGVSIRRKPRDDSQTSR